MHKILITGGAGFIGTNFVHYWIKKYPKDEICVIDKLTYAGNENNIKIHEKNNNFRFYQVDICDYDKVMEVFKSRNIDLVIHFAAESHVDRSIRCPDLFIHSNIIGTHTLLKVAVDYWINNEITEHRFHHISTDEVYGSLDLAEPAFTENNAYNPRSPYSASKSSSDHLVRAYHHTYGLNITISNCTNNYGPYHYPEKLIPLSIINIVYGKNIPIYGKGENIRDWLYVIDHCYAIEKIINSGIPGQTYNIGGLSELSNIDVVNAICELMVEEFDKNENYKKLYPDSPISKNIPPKKLIKYIKDRPGHDLRYAMDISKINSELGFSPTETFITGLRKTIKWYLDNPEWWKPLLDNTFYEWIKDNYGNELNSDKHG